MEYSAVEVKNGACVVRKDAKGVTLLNVGALVTLDTGASKHIIKFANVKEFDDWVLSLSKIHNALVVHEMTMRRLVARGEVG